MGRDEWDTHPSIVPHVYIYAEGETSLRQPSPLGSPHSALGSQRASPVTFQTSAPAGRQHLSTRESFEPTTKDASPTQPIPADLPHVAARSSPGSGGSDALLERLMVLEALEPSGPLATKSAASARADAAAAAANAQLDEMAALGRSDGESWPGRSSLVESWRRTGRHVGLLLPVARGTSPPPGWAPLCHPPEELSPRASAALRGFDDEPQLSPTSRRRLAWQAACAASKERAHHKAVQQKKQKKAKQKKSGQAAQNLITEMHDASASRIQAVERGRAARVLVRQMRQAAVQAVEAKARYMPKMQAAAPPVMHTVSWADDQLQAPAIRVQAAARRRLARRRAKQLRVESTQAPPAGMPPAAAPTSVAPRMQLLWDSNGNPMPAWIDSLPSVPMTLLDLTDIRDLQLLTVVTSWEPRCNGDYYVAAPAAGERLPKKQKGFRLLLRAWDPLPILPEPQTPLQSPAPPTVESAVDGTGSPLLQSSPGPGSPPSTPKTASPASPASPASAKSPPMEPASPPLEWNQSPDSILDAAKRASSPTSPPYSTPARLDEGPPERSSGATRFGHNVEVVALLSLDHKTKSHKVLRARRPKALAAHAPDQTTFRGDAQTNNHKRLR